MWKIIRTVKLTEWMDEIKASIITGLFYFLAKWKSNNENGTLIF
jgi:hypothetical protein